MLDRDGPEVLLTRAECLALLASRSVGRIAVTSDAMPVIVPVQYCVDGDRILITTTPGSKLAAATERAVVAFEADDSDGTTDTAWSVSVTGVATVVTDRDELARVGRLPLWASDGVDHAVVVITTPIISGRRT